MKISKPTILLRSGWNRYNFGDVAHTPGFLRLAEQHIPEAHVIVWAASYPEWLSGYLKARFPQYDVVQGWIGRDGQGADEAISRAFDQAELFVWNSGPIVGYGHEILDGPILREGWRSFNWNPTMQALIPYYYSLSKGVPFGAFAQGFIHVAPPADALVQNILSQAEFVSCRESDSLRYLKSLGVHAPDMGLTPDAAWACDLTQDETTLPWMEAMGLEEGRFLAVTTRPPPAGVAEETDLKCQHALWTAVMETWLSKTDMPVVLIPETRNSIEHNKSAIAAVVRSAHQDRIIIDDTLWGDEKEFWLPDQANSILKRAFAYINVDHHGTLFSLAAGVPTIHPCQRLAGRKQYIYHDLDLSDWMYDIYTDRPVDVCKALTGIIEDHAGASVRARTAATKVRDMQRERMMAIRKLIGLGG